MPLRVYYLDDEPVLCENMIDILTSDDVIIETFQDPKKLISQCETVKPDLIFLDYRLPDTNGEKVALKLDNSIPKALITGDLSIKTSYKFIAILEKPTDEKDLWTVIRNISKKNL